MDRDVRQSPGPLDDLAEQARRHAAATGGRTTASVDRRRARVEGARTHIDPLTGAALRELGLATLQSEIARARGTGEPFVLAYVDVDGMTALNAREGRASGDALLRSVGQALRMKLRSYDPIVRIGGDEFLCGMVCAELDAAYRRMAEIRSAVAIGWPNGSISAGLARLEPNDTLERLLRRARQELGSEQHLGSPLR